MDRRFDRSGPTLQRVLLLEYTRAVAVRRIVQVVDAGLLDDQDVGAIARDPGEGAMSAVGEDSASRSANCEEHPEPCTKTSRGRGDARSLRRLGHVERDPAPERVLGFEALEGRPGNGSEAIECGSSAPAPASPPRGTAEPAY